MGVVGHTSRYLELDSHYTDDDLELLYSGTHGMAAQNLSMLKGVNPCGDIQIVGADTNDITIEYSFQATPVFPGARWNNR